MSKTLRRFGSTAIPMHLALFNIPLNVAVRFEIPLVVWGENSAFEYGAASESHAGFRLDAAWLTSYGVTHGTTAEDWIDAELSAKSLAAYFGPDADNLEAAGVRAIFLGYYLPWDPDETHRVASRVGFAADADGPRTGYYSYADIDDDFISIHHWLKWYKFGFTRLFDNLALEIRNGRMSREDAIDIIGRTGARPPMRDIEQFCAFSSLSADEFFETCERFRNPAIWRKNSAGEWFIPDFLISEWNWSV
jgi:hypothetical protein